MDMSKLERDMRKLIDDAERAGWNGAVNACREMLPAEHSIRLRALYKPEPRGHGEG